MTNNGKDPKPARAGFDCVDRQTTWPGWMRILSGLGAVGVLIAGICIAAVPGFEIRHAQTPGGSGLVLTGTTAVVVGIGVVVWGAVFLAYVLFPHFALWSSRFRRRPAKDE